LEANNSAANHEIPRILWNHTVHYHFYNSLPLVLILSQIKLASGFHPISLTAILVLFSFLQVYLLTPCVCLSTPTHVPRAIPVPSSLI